MGTPAKAISCVAPKPSVPVITVRRAVHVSVRRVITPPMTAVALMRMVPITDQRTDDETGASTDRGAPPAVVAQITAVMTDHRTGDAAQHGTSDRVAG